MSKKVHLQNFGYSILQIETMGICSMACRFCPYPLREDKRSVLPEAVVFQLLDQLDPAAGPFEYVCFSQFNEPLMDKRLFSFIRYAKKRGIPLLLITNALMLDRAKTVDELLDASPDFMKISLQTVNHATFNAVRGIKIDIDKYFQKIYSFLSAARGSSIKITIDVGSNFLPFWKLAATKILGLASGDPSIANTWSALRNDVGTFLVGLRQFDPAFSFDLNDFDRPLKGMSKHYMEEKGVELAANTAMKIKPFTYGHALQDFYPARHPFSCNNRILGVLADGSVTPCCRVYDSSSLSLGNVKKQSLSEILEQSKLFFANLRGKNQLKEETCKKCFGQPTRRGVWVKQLLQNARSRVNR